MAIRTGETTSEIVVREHLEQIRRLNPDLNAVVALREQEAISEAMQADRALREGAPLGPLHGVPITIKDAFRVQDSPTTYGLPQYSRYRPRTDCEPVRALRQAGAIVMGRTNVPLAVFDWQCKNPIYGETKNPWDLSRTPGGSSGGAAAALAAGFTPIELGSDVGGSIRYPAHCCGVLGLRTSVGLIPMGDSGPEDLSAFFEELVVCGPMARDWDDLLLMLSILKREESPSAPPKQKLRVALSCSILGVETAPEISRALEDLALHLTAQGHEVHWTEPKVEWADAYRLWGHLIGHEYQSILPALLRSGPGRALFEAYFLRYRLGNGPLTQFFKEGLRTTPQEYQLAREAHRRLTLAGDEFFSSFDMWILPSSPTEAIPRQRGGRPIWHQGQELPYSTLIGSYLCPLVLLGTPALAMPLGKGGNGMPIGVQIHGKRFSDFDLVRACNGLFSNQYVFSAPQGY